MQTRETVMDGLSQALEAADFVHALWEGGAAAFDRLDEWSDIDVYVLVDDGRVGDAFDRIEDTLEKTGGIKLKYDIGERQWPGLYQKFYKLRDASEFLLLDVAVVTRSSKEKLIEPEIHGSAVMYFNKSDALKVAHLDFKDFEERISKRVVRLRERNEIFNVFVQKEINRGNWIEAVDMYRAVVLDSLTEALRIEHNPLHFDFKTRYVHRELPPSVVARLKELYFVKDQEELKAKYALASAWFRETIDSIQRGGVRLYR